ncbi:MAG TPA: hypothetical protein VHX61_06905 [Rhizomicrobium sp.]|jgi:hypothetical protein|nr:hypothetical protein [Rhizomicrobium sp.]
MKFVKISLLGACLLVCGCAANPESIQPSYVSVLTYSNFTCEQLGEEEARINAAYVTAADQQNNARTLDAEGCASGPSDRFHDR